MCILFHFMPVDSCKCYNLGLPLHALYKPVEFFFTFTCILPLPTSAFVPQISMSVKRPQMSAMEASAPTHQEHTSACVSMVSCHRRI